MLLANEYSQLGKHIAAAAGFSLNLVLWRESGYFDTVAALKPLLHLWSLGVEEQFYIVWPLVLWLAWKCRVNAFVLTLCIIAISFGLSARTTPTDPVSAFYSPITRFWELSIGCALALRKTSRPVALEEPVAFVQNVQASVGVLLIVGSVFGLNRSVEFPGWWALPPTCGALLLISADPRAWINRRILAHPSLVWVGLISYPLYLWHWPLLSFARIHRGVPLPRTERIGLAALSVVLAWLTYRFIERPVRGGRGVSVGVLIALMIATGSVGRYTFKSEGFAGRFPAALRAYASYRYSPLADTRPGCWLGAEQPFTEYADNCADAPPPQGEAKPLVLVWGDSYAARLFAGINVARRDRYRLAQFTRDSCPPLLGYGLTGCGQGNALILKKIEETRPSVVVLFANWKGYDRKWGSESDIAKGLFATISALTNIHIPEVVVVGPAPQWERNLPEILYAAAARNAPSHDVPRRLALELDVTYPG